MALLDVKNLAVTFATDRGEAKALNGIDLTISAGETLAVVGESGSGKSVTALAILGLLPKRTAKVSADALRFDGRDLSALSEDQLREMRGNDIGMVFQDPMTSLNPVLTVGRQLSELGEVHLGMSRTEAEKLAAQMLDQVGIPQAKARLRDYPHQFSGGMRQRVGIAMAIACKPRLLIADEPTTALDVTVQAQILELLAEIQAEMGMAIMLVTHDLGVVARIADRVQVMYAGRVVETGPADGVFAETSMPYTRALLRSVPRVDVSDEGPLRPIQGSPPDVMRLPQGCSFAPRCDLAVAQCRVEEPPLINCGANHRAACIFAGSST
ncbi:ABC transporter ATP-binding protein [Gymnodinialimonas ceratoperidinii]|uniref:ABC transporter ATP-binding protein n=1 Tax=Gymnodinialimonas ceratoperidinii TaxID=2856823 RepID=A0A8F6TY62_9RHOB|nr:ABC transporter ATP-binding protein [Gymnodinialimonas ceratoperidinii]QXT39856.1 ABC transporter ATP-binding protein [Gymnodinialimonas ceratoperidinii]